MSAKTGIFKRFDSNKAKVFSLFLLCSFFAWAISKLSEQYVSAAQFKVVYKNIPNNLLAKDQAKDPISAKIKASGFQFLSYALSQKTISLDLSQVLQEDQRYFLTAATLKNQLDRQLPNSVALEDLNTPIYYTDLYLVATKKVKVNLQLSLKMARNHVLKEGLKLVPDSVLIKGPETALTQINELKTQPFSLKEINKNFSQKLSLENLDSLGVVVTGTKTVALSGQVVRFSEKEFLLSIKAKNTPVGYRLRMFPDQVKLRCKAGVKRLRSLSEKDFLLFVDYNQKTDSKYLSVHLEAPPAEVFSVRLLQEQIEFVLEKK